MQLGTATLSMTKSHQQNYSPRNEIDGTIFLKIIKTWKQIFKIGGAKLFFFLPKLGTKNTLKPSKIGNKKLLSWTDVTKIVTCGILHMDRHVRLFSTKYLSNLIYDLC
jgi:hypothetical protein